ncbi:capsular polysaccharide transport system permease protein [Methylobacterium brachiatum]|uniref:Capsular polysaccharide transport system permease protein n=1 Tax=Methylobacterium brachiatum TaxID=269660 RepID=A0AAJ1WW64_9HYPH|nr:capsule biosynthesis protein [Methylobacterium brachiatum]MCB4804304.1 capsule biosynthesis protein [Methylobacterium brachiatum]MDQ0545324.1 capsular polysaccharide transport system permease protein [Methylobacterium brachiatum]
MTTDIRETDGSPVPASQRRTAIASALRQFARVPGLADHRTGIRSYQSHVKADPWIPILFALCFALPTLAGAVYYGLIASDRYVTETRFAIRPTIGTADKATSDAVGTNAGVPNQMIAQDTLITLEYVHSRPMLEALEAKLPIRAWFSRDSIDYFSRFDADKPIEKLLRYWKRRVTIDVESGSGVMFLSVEAFDPAESFAIAEAVLSEAERMLNGLSAPARQDALSESARELQGAEQRLINARRTVNDLRNREGVIDAQKSNEAALKTIGDLRSSRINLAVQLGIGQRDLGPQSRQIIDLKQRINDLDDNIARVERQLAGGDPAQKRLLSDALTRFEALDNGRKNAEKYYEQVRVAHERARIVAAQQVETFAAIVQPAKAESSTEPRRILMISLITAGAATLFATTLFARKVIA